MKSDQLESLLRYRIKQAHETLREAEILFEQSALRGAVSRAYYAMFYALLALLATRQLGTSRHSGALGLFDREFVRTGLFSRDLSRSLRMAFDRRQRYDYGELADIDKMTTQEALDDAKTFISAAEAYLHSTGYLTIDGG
ncbi:MAG: HEPN domain-containing protein [bacterium]